MCVLCAHGLIWLVGSQLEVLKVCSVTPDAVTLALNTNPFANLIKSLLPALRSCSKIKACLSLL